MSRATETYSDAAAGRKKCDGCSKYIGTSFHQCVCGHYFAKKIKLDRTNLVALVDAMNKIKAGTFGTAEKPDFKKPTYDDFRSASASEFEELKRKAEAWDLFEKDVLDVEVKGYLIQEFGG